MPRQKSSSARPAPESAWRIPTAAVALALAALDAIVFWPVRTFDLVNWDDPSYITENANVLGGLSWANVRWALTTSHSPYWHPMTWLSHLLDVTLFGTDAGWYHVTNLALHAGSTVLLFLVLQRMTRSTGRAAFVAALFGVHPLHVESVAWIAERKDVLSTFFWMVTVWLYLRYEERPDWRRYLPVVGGFALALASKPMVVTLPLVLLLLDAWPLQRRETWSRLAIEKIPLLALAAVTSLATIVVQHRVGAMARFDALPWHTRAGNALVGYLAYVGKAVWPVRLAAFYPLHQYSALTVTAAGAALAVVTILSVRASRTRPWLTVGWLWFLMTLAPVIGLLQAGEQAMADRFMYVPLIGLAIAVGWEAPALGARWRIGATAQALAATVIVVLSSVVAHAQVEHWADSLTLWTHAVAVTPDNYIAYENLAQAQRERGRYEEALTNYRLALQHAPPGSPGYAAVIENAIGVTLTREDRIDEASQAFSAAVQADPSFAEPHSNLGNALAAEGRFREAREHYQTAVRLKPDVVEAHLGLGSTLLSEGRSAEAIPHYRTALRLDPTLAQAHNGLGAALAREGHSAEAMQEYQEALRLKPDLATAHYNMAVLFLVQNNPGEARRHLETALSIDPAYTPARQALEALR